MVDLTLRSQCRHIAGSQTQFVLAMPCNALTLGMARGHVGSIRLVRHMMHHGSEAEIKTRQTSSLLCMYLGTYITVLQIAGSNAKILVVMSCNHTRSLPWLFFCHVITALTLCLRVLNICSKSTERSRIIQLALIHYCQNRE